jgi:hypothetical protein
MWAALLLIVSLSQYPAEARPSDKGVAGENTSPRLGRFEFIEGQESLTQDSTLD